MTCGHKGVNKCGQVEKALWPHKPKQCISWQTLPYSIFHAHHPAPSDHHHSPPPSSSKGRLWLLFLQSLTQIQHIHDSYSSQKWQMESGLQFRFQRLHHMKIMWFRRTIAQWAHPGDTGEPRFYFSKVQKAFLPCVDGSPSLRGILFPQLLPSRWHVSYPHAASCTFILSSLGLFIQKKVNPLVYFFFSSSRCGITDHICFCDSGDKV